MVSQAGRDLPDDLANRPKIQSYWQTFRFDGTHNLVNKIIRDGDDQREKGVQVLELGIEDVDGQPYDEPLSVLASKLYQQLLPFIKQGDLTKYDFRMRKNGTGYTTSHEIARVPRTT